MKKTFLIFGVFLFLILGNFYIGGDFSIHTQEAFANEMNIEDSKIKEMLCEDGETTYKECRAYVTESCRVDDQTTCPVPVGN